MYFTKVYFIFLQIVSISFMRFVLLLLGLSLCSSFSAVAQRAPMVPAEVMGAETCRECHEEQVAQWEKSSHFGSFAELTKMDSAREMAEILGYQPVDIPTKASCVRCHFTEEVLSGVPQTTSAISCESCHTAAAPWIEVHNSRGSTRQSRVDESLSLGMAHPASIFSVSKSCFECHIVDDEQLVNQAGHPALSRNFEILSWYSGEVNHNFLVNKGSGLRKHANELQPIPQSRRRMLYLNGKLLHLGYLLQAMAGARDAPVDKKGNFIQLKDGNFTYSVQLAQEAKRIEHDLERITKRVSVSQFIEALALLKSLRWETGNGPDFLEASESIFDLAEAFCRKNDGSNLGAIDSLLDELKPRYSESTSE